MKKFLKNNWVELVVLFAVILGAFLVIERTLLRSWLLNSMAPSLKEVGSGLSQSVQQIYTYLSQLSVSELIGYSLVFLSLIFILFRIRYRFLTSDYYREPTCPRCGSDLHRIHRSKLDRFLSKILFPHARRYLCKKSECGWTGLKNIERGRRRSHREDESLDSE
jgi:hypothetical protein